MNNKKVLIIGASTRPHRYSYMATERLLKAGFEVYLLAKRTDEVLGQQIHTEMPESQTIDTVTLYIGANHQGDLFNQLQELQPNRVIFNPGTENVELQRLLEKEGIKVEVNCTLVMLSLKHF